MQAGAAEQVGAPPSESLPTRRHWRCAVRGAMRADPHLPTVLLVWALCLVALVVHLHQHNSPFPWADEWELTGAATGMFPVNWSWIMHPQGEHRTPLTRLEVLWLGCLTGWDFRFAHYVNVGLLGFASLCLILAVRTYRGRAALSDAFCALLLLTPWQYETAIVYAYAYAMALACWCGACAWAMTGGYLRSCSRLLGYLALALVVTLAGGPAGNLWAIGLCGVLARGWVEKKERKWKSTALLGSLVVVGISVALLLWTPRAPHHNHLRSDSWQTTLQASLRLSVVWLGTCVHFTWPWASLVVLVPGAYVVGRVFWDLCALCGGPGDRLRAHLARWLDLVILLAVCAVVIVLIGYGRGRTPNLIQSRYCALLLPTGLLLYLLGVRFRSQLVPGALAVVMAVACGWNWPDALSVVGHWAEGRDELWQTLRCPKQSLTELAREHGRLVGYSCDPEKLAVFWMQLKQAELSAFRKDRQREPVPGLGFSQLVEAWRGRLDPSLKVVYDLKAAGGQLPGYAGAHYGRAVEVTLPDLQPATASYDITVPADGRYELCPRVWVPGGIHILTVAVDQDTPRKRYLPDAPTYYTYSGDPILLDLSAGKHQLTITLSAAGSNMKLDVLELIPRAAGLPGSVARHAARAAPPVTSGHEE